MPMHPQRIEQGVAKRSTMTPVPPASLNPAGSLDNQELNGPQMTSGSTGEFMALCAIHQHFGRPGTPPTRPGPGSLVGHLKVEWPHLTTIRDPAVLPAELAIVRERYNGVRLYAGIGYVTPTTSTRAVARRSARPARLDWSRPAHLDSGTSGLR
jgi:putative transposase